MDLNSLQLLALTLTNERSVDTILRMIVEGLSRVPGKALARLWLIAPGDICETCPMRTECPDQTRCLHLVASDGQSVDSDRPRWSRIDGAYRRFPLGVRKVGKIGATGRPARLTDVSADSSWLCDPQWAQHEAIRGFAGQPLKFRGETLGVLAVFSRDNLDEGCMMILRAFADQAAAAIASARAFEEIDRLRAQLELENEYLREEVRQSHDFGDIVGQSSALGKVLDQIELVAPTETSVLIQGESGAGKELIARAIHDRGGRSDRPLVRVNCASIPRELFESEFFGHVKGSFTGAIKDRVGRFQLADRGTLFLDEVAEIPLELQSKLLRVLQEGEFERVGEDVTRRVNVRIIAATNRDLKADVEERRFRQDLYFRLSVFPIEIPPLRERPEDIPLLAAHFLEQACRRLGIAQPPLKHRHILDLQNHDWPGNVRELQNVIERAVIQARGSGALQFSLGGERGASAPPTAAAPGPGEPDGGILTYDALKELERRNLVAALEQTGWRVSGENGAADLLGLKPTTLASKLKSLAVEKPAAGR